MTECDRFLESLLLGDRRAADAVIDRLIDRGVPLQRVYADVIQPAMYEVGRRWQTNAITVADEHLATAIVQASMGRAFDRLYRWRESRAPTLIAACVGDERHAIGIRMLCDLLELDGWNTTFLGASMPLESLVDMTCKRQPEYVALSAATAPSLVRMRDAIAAIRECTKEQEPAIVIGGLAVRGDEALARRLGADLTATDVAEAAELLSKRVSDRKLGP